MLNPDVKLVCPFEGCDGEYSEDVLSPIDTKIRDDYIKFKALQEEQVRAAAAGGGSGGERTVQENAVIKAPCCGKMVTGFDACCKVHCSCGKSWCAWCFKIQRDEEHNDDFYTHIRNCELNPEFSIYPSEKAKKILVKMWMARQTEQLARKFGFDLADPRG